MRRTDFSTWITVGITLVLLSGCATTGGQRYVPIFDYSPPQQAKPAGANVTFAVVGANYPRTVPLFHKFGQNISQDFFEILTARGYTVRGPFGTYDDVTFPDKKGSDLILMPNLQIDWDVSGLTWDQSLGLALLGASGYTGEGTVVLSGRVTLSVEESLSREKMWTKSVEIPPVTLRVEETKIYKTPDVPIQQLLENEPAVYNVVAKALETQYRSILEKASQYLDPDEMQIVKKQAHEIRNKKVY